MARFVVVVHPRMTKELKAIEKAGRRDIVRRILRALQSLEEDPFRARSGLDIKLLAAAEGAVYRLRIGDYRVLYEVDMGSGRVYVTGVFHRGRGYRD